MASKIIKIGLANDKIFGNVGLPYFFATYGRTALQIVELNTVFSLLFANIFN